MKKFVIVLGIIFLVIAGFYLYQFEQNKKQTILVEKKKQELIANIYNKMQFFINEELIEPTDEIETFFNEKMQVHKDIQNLTPQNITLINIDSKNIANTLKLFQEKQKNIEKIEQILNQTLDSVLTNLDEISKNTYNEIYQSSKISSQQKNDIDKVLSYKSNLIKQQKLLQFLNENVQFYSIVNNKIMYKTDAFYTKYKENIQELNIDFKIEKIDILGKKIPILMYHGILDKPWGDSSLFVRVKEFDEQMAYLKQEGYTPIYLTEIKNADKYEKPVIITFDDGYMDVYTYGYPILKKYDFKANFYVISGWVNGDGYVTEEILKKMSDDNFLIGSHTVNHSALGWLSREEVEKQLVNSKQQLEQMLNKTITTIAYPTGSYNNMVVNEAKKYYDYALTTVTGFEYKNSMQSHTLKRFKVNRGISLKTFAKFLD